MVLDYEDGMLPWVEPARLEADIRDAMIRLCADVVITSEGRSTGIRITLRFMSGRLRRFERWAPPLQRCTT